MPRGEFAPINKDSFRQPSLIVIFLWALDSAGGLTCDYHNFAFSSWAGASWGDLSDGGNAVVGAEGF